MPESRTRWETMEEDFFSEVETEHRPSAVSSVNEEIESPESKENIIPNERIALPLFPFFIEVMGQFTEILSTLRNHTQNFQEKVSGRELGASLNRMITEDIKKIELVQNSLLNYIRIDNPIIKTDTVNILLEEELKKYQVELEEKKIKLFKTLEKGLPESAVPDDQLRYILSCLLQYVMALILPNGNFGLFTRSVAPQKEMGEGQALGKKGEKYIEILMVCMDYKKPTISSGMAFGIQTRQEKGMLDLALRLVDMIVKRNRGMMKLEVDEKKAKTSISLRFPMERRKVVYYQGPTESSSNVHPSKSTFEKLLSIQDLRKRG